MGSPGGQRAALEQMGREGVSRSMRRKGLSTGRGGERGGRREEGIEKIGESSTCRAQVRRGGTDAGGWRRVCTDESKSAETQAEEGAQTLEAGGACVAGEVQVQRDPSDWGGAAAGSLRPWEAHVYILSRGLELYCRVVVVL